MKPIKFRPAKVSKRGIYIQDVELKETSFQPGSHYKYVIDQKNHKITIVPTEDPTQNTVSKREIQTGIKPVIDIRKQEARSIFTECDYLQVSIFNDEIIVEGFDQKKKTGILDKIQQKIKTPFKKKERKASDITQLVSVKKKATAVFSKKDLQAVAGEQITFDLFDFETHTETDSTESTYLQGALKNAHIPLQVASLFSGAGVMDEGFKQMDYSIEFALEKDEEASMTYRYNHGDHIVVHDITSFDKRKIPKTPIMVGGPPCQGFSNSNRHTHFLDNPNNFLMKEYIKSVQANEACKVFVIENVPQLLTAGEGQFKREIENELADFEITSGVLSSADFGEAQDRKRAIIIGSKIGKIELPNKSSSIPRTVREAFEGLDSFTPNQQDFSKPRKDTVERMKHVPQGGNWQDIPDTLKTVKMFKGETHSSMYKRLEWDKPSITIVNPRKALITHPEENRILSVRECARLFGLPDSYIFKGTLASMQQQISNAVPVKLSKAIAKVVKTAISQFNIRNKTESLSLI